jgi:hypothetical protein
MGDAPLVLLDVLIVVAPPRNPLVAPRAQWTRVLGSFWRLPVVLLVHG